MVNRILRAAGFINSATSGTEKLARRGMLNAYRSDSSEQTPIIYAVALLFMLTLIRRISLRYERDATEKKTEANSNPISKAERKPTIESVHKNVELGNAYRMELLKQSLTIAAAILAFSVTFRPTLTKVEYAWLMWGGWLALAISVSSGMLHMLLWSYFYVSHRDYDWRDRPSEGKAHRNLITSWRRFVMFLQFLGFACGVVGIGLFAALNFQNMVPPK